MRKIAPIALMTVLAACGGGGGGGSAYSGTWKFQGSKVSDNCRTGLSQNLSVDLIVEQDGDSVTIQSGRIVAPGNVNDRDGVTVTYAGPGTNGCAQGVSIAFSGASDGFADVGYVLGVQCGNRTCVVGYSGTATRTAKVSDQDASGDNSDSLIEALGEVVVTSEVGVDGGIESALEEAQLGLESSRDK